VFSVTSDIAANLSLQSTPSRSARTDQAAAPDSFSALIDGNAADTGNDRPAAAPPDRPSPRTDDTAADTRQPRDTTSSSSAASTTASQDTEPGATQPATSEGGVDADTASKPKSGAAKSGIASEAKDAALDLVAAPDAAASSGAAASPQPVPPTAATPAPVAIAIAVSVAATDVIVIVAPASPGSTSQPLAIAAAAIATSASTVEASKLPATPAQAQTAPEKPTAAVPNPAVTTEPTAATATTAVNIAAVGANAASSNTTQAAATDTVATPVTQPEAKPDATAQARPELAAAAVTATPVAPVAPKVAPKTTAAARAAESAAPIKTGVQSNAAEPSVPSPSTDATDKSVAPRGPVVDGKQKLDGVAVDATKANTANTDAPTTAATVAVHEHRATAAAQVQTESSDAGQAANAIQQPQVQSATTPVTTAQLTVTAATSAAVPLNGLALQIAVTAQSGRSRFEIRLDPAELGRIDVRIDVDRHGQLTSHLTVEKPETLAMLRQDAPQLQRALDNAGFKTGDGGLQFSLRDQSSSGRNNGNEAGRNAQRLIISEDDSVPAAVAGRTYGRMPGSGSGVDIRV
jgi:flagellar hook-length control protein FliK